MKKYFLLLDLQKYFKTHNKEYKKKTKNNRVKKDVI